MTESPSATFAVVTGGGTAGHVLPALAVAEALVARGHDPASIVYAGCERGIETRLLPGTPFPHRFYDVIGLQRSVTRRNLGFVPKLIRSTRQAIKDFRASRPAVVVSVGGYASVPSVFAARRLKVPVVVVSYDRTPGRASRLSARRAVACAVAFENSPLPRAEITGAPVRQAIFDVDRMAGRAAARARLGLPEDRFVVAVMGGSQGSGVLNGAVADYLEQHVSRQSARRPTSSRGSLSGRDRPGRRGCRRRDRACSTNSLATKMTCRRSTPLPIYSSDAAGRARCTKLQSQGRQRSWCRGRMRLTITRPTTSDG